jgi:hypothetical protein
MNGFDSASALGGRARRWRIDEPGTDRYPLRPFGFLEKNTQTEGAFPKGFDHPSQHVQH